MKANDILDIHITKMISENPDEYYTLDEIKSDPMYKVFIEAMNEFAKTKCKEQRKICEEIGGDKCCYYHGDMENAKTPDFE